MEEVVAALLKFLEEHKTFIDVRTKWPGQLQKLKKIYDWEPENVPLGMYPHIQIGNGSYTKTWVAAPYLVEVRYEVELFGYIIHSEDRENAKAIRMFADSVSNLFELKAAEEMEVPGQSYVIHYHSEVPLDEMEIDYDFIGDAFCRSWRAKWHGYITRTAFREE